MKFPHRLLLDLEHWKTLPAAQRTDFYDDKIVPAVATVARSIEENPGDPDLLVGWLRFQAAAVALSTEDIVDVTVGLREKQPVALDRAIADLESVEQHRLQTLFAAWDGSASASAAAPGAAASFFRWPRLFGPRDTQGDLAPVGIRATFVGRNVLRTGRGNPIVHGVFTIHGEDQQPVATYEANTGGGSPSYQITGGPCPPGVYLVSHHRPDRTMDGMVLDGIGFSFDVDPTDGTDVFGRSALRIHPDGGNPGTLGCIGIRESAARLQDCERRLADILDDTGALKMMVLHP